MVKLNLVTVVGDFHINLTLVQMLKHYEPMVDTICINYYSTAKLTRIRSEEIQEFYKYLVDFGLDTSKIAILSRSGKKFDWDEVTTFYNKTTELDLDAYWLIADCDEFHYWPVAPRDIAEECKQKGYTFVTGGFLDRLGKDGSFPEIEGPGTNLDPLFPKVGFFRYPLSGACPNKVVMVKGGQKVVSGQHYALFPDKSTSWGTKHPLRYPVEDCFVQVHHFKWDSTILLRLDEVVKSKCSYFEEYDRMRRSIRDGKLDISKKEFCFEEFDPTLGYDSYRHWFKVRNLIIKV